ncbi:RDD family protein [Marinobacterium sp. AK62]|uniref:RDD family protein n=1 Tax=Marinobacterium alkalitolerans TaxID=1542925 RepID=A0ABS3Z7Y6_9GAMM|nr:RDD family protein [Marinobacterium alkalitolerans]MBP0047817.1 RDD family protein [Marinobacterium alkalitolerans]
MHRPFKQEFSQTAPASFIKRLMAMIYDSLLIVALWMVIGAISVALNDGEAISIETSPASAVALFNSALFCATFLFFGFFWTRNGQTLGMLAWRLRVQTLAGGRMSWSQALVRFLLAIPSLGLFGIGFLWMLVTDERLCLHDRWSGTCMVQLPKPEKKKKDKAKG